MRGGSMRTRLNTLILAGILLPALSAYAQSPLPDVQPEFVVNTVTAGNQTAPAVAASAAGTLWIAWIDEGQQPPGIKARRFGPSGAPLGREIPVNARFGFSPLAIFAGPRNGPTADGGCVVVWAETPNVWFRRFDRDGAPLGDEQRIAPSASFESIYFPEVAVASEGSFVVAWLQSDLLTDAIRAQRFDPQGQSLGTPLTVTSEARNTLWTLRMAGAADGGFLAVWQQQGTILALRFVGATGTGSTSRQVNEPGIDSAYDRLGRPGTGLEQRRFLHRPLLPTAVDPGTGRRRPGHRRPDPRARPLCRRLRAPLSRAGPPVRSPRELEEPEHRRDRQRPLVPAHRRHRLLLVF